MNLRQLVQSAVVLGVLQLLVTPTSLVAGKYNPILKIGDKAPDWPELPGVDGKQYALKDFKQEVLVVVFTCNSCPYAVAYEDRLIDFVKRRCTKKDAKVALVAINVNKVKADLLPAMKEKAEKKKFRFPYVFDESQKTAKEYGATYTPEFFVLDRDRKIVYMGAMDDSDDPKKAKRKYVELAVDATLAKTPPEVAETVAVGCTIRWERSRRRRKKER